MNRKYPRAKWHDYNAGVYFVTVCTHRRIHYLGKIANDEIIHSEIGEHLCRSIEELGMHYPGTSVDRYVVMPNHFHAIITVGSRHAAATDVDAPAAPTATGPIGCLRPRRHPEECDNFNERNHFNSLLSRAIGGVKSAVTRQARLAGSDFRWQANFHDHIIRNQREYDLIAEYIDNNVENWVKDKLYSLT